MSCPACIALRLHTPDEREVYHPLAGHGCIDGRWTSPEAERAHLDEVRRWKEDRTHVA